MASERTSRRGSEARPRWRAASILAGVLALAIPGAAGATGNAAHCAESAERAQSLWKRGKLIDAHAALRECLKPSCPRIVRDDCTTWEPQLEAAVPTVVVAAKNADGEDVTDAVITIDGKRLEGTSTGLASPLDPGSHVFRFTRDGSPPVERTVVVREGEKRRLVEARFGADSRSGDAAPTSTASKAATSGPPPATETPGSGPPALAWALGGAGVAAVGAFAVLGLTGLDRYHTLHAECGSTRTCTSSEIDGNRTQLWVADALGLVGIAALSVALWIWIDAPSPRAARAARHPLVLGTF